MNSFCTSVYSFLLCTWKPKTPHTRSGCFCQLKGTFHHFTCKSSTIQVNDMFCTLCWQRFQPLSLNLRVHSFKHICRPRRANKIRVCLWASTNYPNFACSCKPPLTPLSYLGLHTWGYGPSSNQRGGEVLGEVLGEQAFLYTYSFSDMNILFCFIFAFSFASLQ
jgi:hypothetical protein